MQFFVKFVVEFEFDEPISIDHDQPAILMVNSCWVQIYYLFYQDNGLSSGVQGECAAALIIKQLINFKFAPYFCSLLVARVRVPHYFFLLFIFQFFELALHKTVSKNVHAVNAATRWQSDERDGARHPLEGLIRLQEINNSVNFTHR